MLRRQLLVGIAGLTGGVIFGGSSTAFAAPDNPADIQAVRAALAAAHADHQACRYRELARRLPRLVRDAAAVRAAAHADGICAAEALLADAYGLATHLAIKLHDNAAAATNLDRALRAAQACGDPIIEADTHRWAAVILRRSTDKSKAQDAVLDAADRLVAQTGLGTPEHVSAYAALQATAAYTAAIQDDRSSALDLIAEAEQQCRRLAGGHSTSYRQAIGFGGIDVAVYKIGIARKLGDFGQAVKYARAVRPEQITSVERITRYYEDTALALCGKGDYSEAFQTLLTAERLAPQEVRYRPWVQELTLELLHADKRSALPGLRAFADRASIA